jgi:hypothetical protein
MDTHKLPHTGGLHYGWVILLVSTLTVLGALGFAGLAIR